MQVKHSGRFIGQSKKLPLLIKVKLAHLLVLLEANIYNPLLHTKRLSGEFDGLYSFRVSRDWRVIFSIEFTGNIRLLEVAHRKDIYR